MTNVLMQKDGQADIMVDSSQVASHTQLGWRRAGIGVSADAQTLTIPDTVSEVVRSGLSTLSAMTVAKYKITPLAVSAVAVLAATHLNATDPIVVTSGLHDPDVPRTLTVKGNAAGIAGDVVIAGRNSNGELITDTIALSEATEVEGIKAFTHVISVTLPAATNGITDTVSLGYAKKFGTPGILAHAGFLLIKLFNTSADSGSLALDADLSKNLFALDGTPDGAAALELIYLV